MFHKQSIVFVAAALLLLEANASNISKMTRRHAVEEKHEHEREKTSDVDVSIHKDENEKDSSSRIEDIDVPMSGDEEDGTSGGVDDGNNERSRRSVGVSVSGSSGGGNSNGGCNCGQFREIMGKVMFLLKTYGSKELIPDLQNLAMKAVNYFLDHLAREKPEQLSKVHDFLTSTTKVTGSFVESASGSFSGSSKSGLLSTFG